MGCAALGPPALYGDPDDACGAPGEAELAYHLARGHWGRGYATEVGRTLVLHGLERLGLERVVALVDPRNLRSLAVVARLGLSPDGEREVGERRLACFTARRGAWPPAGIARAAPDPPRR